jgi:ABC-type antimicrobial peptide transport system permease subunit
MRAVRPALSSVDPRLLVSDISTMRARMGETVAEQRYRMRLMLSFSVLALVFAIAGVYGVLNRSVARRRRELGIRAALGAVRRDVVMMLLRHSLVLGAIGVSIGLVAGYFGTSVLESTLYDTQRNDPVTVLVIGVLVLGLSLVAAWQPANRAAKVDPMEVLRE